MSNTLVNWREWNDEAFEAARAEQKPILLGISAVWCHWCHVMDRGVAGDPQHTGVYSDPDIAAYINENFIPVRVDNDQRPDINARYNQGGWPTTCFLTPDGEVLYGGTYFAPAQMRNLLPQIMQYWRENRAMLLDRVNESVAEAAPAPAQNPSLPDDIFSNVVMSIARNYDTRHGGLGNATKFPMSDAWALLLNVSDDAKLPTPGGDMKPLDMVTQTLIAMGTRGMYDMAEGGWFRYSTTPDWTVPHFEKMLEDYARLLPVYLRAIQRTGDAKLKHIAQESLRYLTEKLLRDTPEATYFAGSQDADEEYYALSNAERAEKTPPFIDWRLYADWNALMVMALLEASVVLNDKKYADLARKVLATLDLLCVGADGAVVHSTSPLLAGGVGGGQVRGLLADQAALAMAHLMLAQHSGSPQEREAVLVMARRLIEFARRELAAPDGGFFDRPADPSAKGLLSTRIKPLQDNAHMAQALVLAYYLADGEANAKAEAIRTLSAVAKDYPRYGEHAAGFAQAVMQATLEPTEIVIVGEGWQAANFAWSAMTPYSSWRVVRVLDPDNDAELIRQRGYPVSKTPVAFVCRGTACSAPIYEASELSV